MTGCCIKDLADDGTMVVDFLSDVVNVFVINFVVDVVAIVVIAGFTSSPAPSFVVVVVVVVISLLSSSSSFGKKILSPAEISLNISKMSAFLATLLRKLVSLAETMSLSWTISVESEEEEEEEEELPVVKMLLFVDEDSRCFVVRPL